MAVKFICRELLVFIGPLFLLGLYLAPSSEVWVFILFACTALVYGLAFPYICGVLPKDNVDVMYYTFAVLGVALFYYSEYIPEAEYELRNKISLNQQLLGQADDILDDVGAYLERAEIKEFAGAQLLGIVEDYKDRFEDRKDECSLESATDYEFCEYRLANYQAAVSIFESGDLRGQRLGPRSVPSLPMNRAQELFLDRYIVLIPPDANSSRGGSIVVPAISVWEALFRRIGREQVRPNNEKAVAEITSSVQEFYVLRIKAIERSKNELNIETDYEAIPWLVLLAQNVWSYLLVTALSMKLARSKVALI